MNGLEIRDTPHGRGVFATRVFRDGEVVERCPVVLLPADEVVFVPRIRALAYNWFPCFQSHWEEGAAVICLGYGALFNSSDEPTLAWDRAVDEDRVVVFTALRDIAPGEEIAYKYAWPDWVARS